MFKARTIDGVVASFKKSVDALDVLAAHHGNTSDGYAEEAKRRAALSEHHKNEAERARRIRSKIADLID